MADLNIIDSNLKELKSIVKSTSADEKGGVLFGFLDETLRTLISSNEEEQSLMNDFSKYLRYSDIKYFTVKSLLSIVKNNVTKLLLSVKLPLGNTSKGREELDRLKPYILDDLFKFNYESASNLYSDTWSMFLAFKLSFDSYKKILASMDTKILPHFKNPLILTDFLINSYKIGGSVSLLSLSSMFLLITKYNLDYPDFYTNFYALVTPEILHVKYRSRFLYWADIFLSSTNLPAYVVASFVKKFSRLALIASVETLYPLIPLIANLLIRHPTLMQLFNKPTNDECIKRDPFVFEETNLKETRALESSLWELKSLQKHWNRKVREEAKFLNYTLPKDEYDLSDLLEIEFPMLVEEAFSTKLEEDLVLNDETCEAALDFFPE